MGKTDNESSDAPKKLSAAERKLLAQTENAKKEEELNKKIIENKKKEDSKASKSKKKSKGSKEKKIIESVQNSDWTTTEYVPPKKDASKSNQSSTYDSGDFKSYNNKHKRNDYKDRSKDTKGSNKGTDIDQAARDAFTDFEENKKKYHSKFREITGDLFDADDDVSLAHCVSEDMRMGAGIAEEFRRAFGKTGELLNQRARVGDVAFLQHKQRYVYYLVTKENFFKKPTHQTLFLSLYKMRAKMQEHGVTKLAVPALGCGLDKLDWGEVTKMLDYVFGSSGVELTIYLYKRGSGQPPRKKRKYSPANWKSHGQETEERQKKLRMCKTIERDFPLLDIESHCVIIYLLSADNKVSEEMRELEKKFRISMDISKNRGLRMGSIVETVSKTNHNLYGLVVKKEKYGPIDFAVLEHCLNEVQKANRKGNNYEYVALQFSVDDHDFSNVTPKIVTLAVFSFRDIQVHVCFPQDYRYFMRSTSAATDY